MSHHFGFNDQRGPYKGVRVVITTNEATPPATYDGVTLDVGDPVLLVGQTNKALNGLKVKGPTQWGQWNYMKQPEELKKGMLVHVAEGTLKGGSFWRLDTAGPYVIGTTELDFSEAIDADGAPAGAVLETDFAAGQSVLAAVSAETPVELVLAQGTVLGRPTGGDVQDLDSTQLKAIVGAANTTTTGVVELADQSETDAGTDTIRPVVPSRLASTPAVHRQRPFVTLTGSTSGTDVDVTFKIYDGKTSPSAVEEVTPVHWWLSSDNTTGAIHGTTPDGGVSATTGVLLTDIDPDLEGHVLTNSTGDGVLNVAHSGGAWQGYLWLRCGQTTSVSGLIDIT